MPSNCVSPPAISLFRDCQLHTLALGQTRAWLAIRTPTAQEFDQPYPGFLLAYHKDVRLPGSEGVVNGIFDMHNVETSVMAFSMCNNSHTAHVTTTSSHGNDSSIEAYEVGDFAGSEFNLDGIVNLDRWVRVANPVFRGYMISSALRTFYQNLVQRLNQCNKLTFVHHA